MTKIHKQAASFVALCCHGLWPFQTWAASCRFTVQWVLKKSWKPCTGLLVGLLLPSVGQHRLPPGASAFQQHSLRSSSNPARGINTCAAALLLRLLWLHHSGQCCWPSGGPAWGAAHGSGRPRCRGGPHPRGGSPHRRGSRTPACAAAWWGAGCRSSASGGRTAGGRGEGRAGLWSVVRATVAGREVPAGTTMAGRHTSSTQTCNKQVGRQTAELRGQR